MTALAGSAFVSKWNGRFADNITREISEEDLREFVQDIEDSFINTTDFEAPSASYAGLTGEPTDNANTVNWGSGLINTVRGGVVTNFNTLLKIYNALAIGDFTVSGNYFYIKYFSGVNTQASGTNEYTTYLNPPISSYSVHQRYFIDFPNVNTTSATLSIDGLPSDPILREDGSSVIPGDLQGLKIIGRSYDNTHWQIIGGRPIDLVPTNGSNNAASSNGVYDALALKADLVSGKVPASQLPSYVDDVLEYADLASLPATGTTGIIYITLDDDKQYRWSGTQYIEMVPSPGTTDAVTEGVNNLYFTEARVRSTDLDGLDTSTGGEITAADLLLAALGKLQYQITNRGINGGTP